MFYKALLSISFVLALFWYWGMYTTQGKKSFDEMAGMIPLFSGVLAILLLIIVILVWIVRKFSK